MPPFCLVLLDDLVLRNVATILMPRHRSGRLQRERLPLSTSPAFLVTAVFVCSGCCAIIVGGAVAVPCDVPFSASLSLPMLSRLGLMPEPAAKRNGWSPGLAQPDLQGERQAAWFSFQFAHAALSGLVFY